MGLELDTSFASMSFVSSPLADPINIGGPRADSDVSEAVACSIPAVHLPQVDQYGAAFGRDIEPTQVCRCMTRRKASMADETNQLRFGAGRVHAVQSDLVALVMRQEGGTVLYDTLASCIRVWRRGIAMANSHCPSTEMCCTGALTGTSLFGLVHHLQYRRLCTLEAVIAHACLQAGHNCSCAA